MAIINLLGILDDGSPIDASARANLRRPIRFVQGENVTLNLAIIYQSGIPVNLSADLSAASVWTIKPNSLDNAIISKVGALVPTSGINRLDFTLLPADTRTVTPGRFIYDIWLTYFSKRYPVVPGSLCTIEPSITPVP